MLTQTQLLGNLVNAKLQYDEAVRAVVGIPKGVYSIPVDFGRETYFVQINEWYAPDVRGPVKKA